MQELVYDGLVILVRVALIVQLYVIYDVIKHRMIRDKSSDRLGMNGLTDCQYPRSVSTHRDRSIASSNIETGRLPPTSDPRATVWTSVPLTYSRTLLLSSRKQSTGDGVYIVELAHDSEENVTSTHTLLGQSASDTGPDVQREYLQSLLQFRALRSNPRVGISWEDWNDEAKRILGGAALLNARGVSTEVYEALMQAGILPDAGTFAALVSTSITVGDVRSARSFLKKMSNSGFIPDKSLIDIVLKEYSQSRTPASLNRDAAEFVPVPVVPVKF